MVRVKAGFYKDDSVWKNMKKNLRAKKSMINLGWFEGQNYGPENYSLPMAQVAQWVEEGQTINSQPPRPAIRTLFIPVLRDSTDLLNMAIPLIHEVAMGKITWKKMHEKMAPSLQYKFKMALKAYNTVPNKPSTIAKKGFNDPWYETGTLIESVRFEIADWKMK